MKVADVQPETLVAAEFGKSKTMFGKIRKLYFVGIGGSGMSGIAEILYNLGFQITGSDYVATDITEYLSSIGITVYPHHRADNLDDAEVVVISSAVGEDNPEVVEARRRGIPVIKRAEMLGELMRLKYSIGVAGTHGKTTTTSMIGKILQLGGYQPTIIVGGVVAELGTGAALGSGEYLVAEADEYDRSFLSMFPTMAVITNLEPDHLDCYDGIEDLTNAFLTYMNRVPFYGSVILSADNERLMRLRDKIARPSVTCGFAVEADYRALNVSMNESQTSFSVYHHGDPLGEINLHVPGTHNVANALTAAAACHELEIPFSDIAEGLNAFTGVGRRFEIIDTVNDIIVVDDYAHHPTEITATLKTARDVYSRRVLVVYQPHLYSRTKDFAHELASSLAIADKCILVDIYPAREEPIPGVTSQLIADYGEKIKPDCFRFVGARENAVEAVRETAQPGDMVIIMGAGSITLIKNKVVEVLKETR